MANAAGPAVAVGYAIGRIGCLLSGDGDYGSPTKSFIGIAFPHGTVPTPPGVKVWPTPPIETVVMLLVGWFLYRMAKRAQPGWYVWGWFMVLAGIERLLIEFIRRNPVVFLGLRTTQWESIGSIAVGVAIILYTRNRPTVEVSLEAARAVHRAAQGRLPARARLARQGLVGQGLGGQGAPSDKAGSGRGPAGRQACQERALRLLTRPTAGGGAAAFWLPACAGTGTSSSGQGASSSRRRTNIERPAANTPPRRAR